MYRIDSPNGMRLAILARPRGGDWLEAEVGSWCEQGVEVAVSLLTADEVAELDLAAEAAACAANGIEFLSVPVPDRGVPPSAEEFRTAVDRVGKSLAAGRSVGVHCRQGVGRSALFAAALLAEVGISPGVAFDCIREARGVPVPETPEQREWVERFATAAPLASVG